jgi:hypothetical protein
MRVYLVLGCWGRKHGEFQMCGGVENEILDITGGTERNAAIAKHLDEVYHLFDRPLYNNVHTVLFSVQDNFSQHGKPVFQKDHYTQLEAFCAMHAKCGLFLRLRLKGEE